jgi:hypothetical protein
VRSRAAIGLALAEARRGDTADAAPLYTSAVKALSDRIGGDHPFVREACTEGDSLRLAGGGVCP